MTGFPPKLCYCFQFLGLVIALLFPSFSFANSDSSSTKQRMQKLDSASAIHFILNDLVKAKITQYGNYKKLIANCLANGQLYFPLIEAELAKNKLPDELKYITVMESGVNPHAGKSGGPAGLWQITNGTGKIMKLENNGLIDNRRDPIQSTQAVCAYFTKLYKMYGDWLLAITAYQIGHGTLDKVIAKSGGKKDYWAIRTHLPAFAQEYMAKFFAVSYVMTYYSLFGINPATPRYKFDQIDTVHVQATSLSQMAGALKVSKEDLAKLNAQVNGNAIPAGSSRAIYLPKEAAQLFRDDRKKVYEFKVQ